MWDFGKCPENEGCALLTVLLSFWGGQDRLPGGTPILTRGGRTSIEGDGNKKTEEAYLLTIMEPPCQPSSQEMKKTLLPYLTFILIFLSPMNLIPTNIDFTCNFSSLPFIPPPIPESLKKGGYTDFSKVFL